jgi:Lrp/AsnC family transcriptional regulator, regulator for asnA, asnC and gidA
MHEIDETDVQIIDLLMEDGRMSAAEIARRLAENITERTVRYRIDRLVENEIIKICAIPNPRTLGYKVIADVFVEVEPGRIKDAAHILAGQENVSYVSCSIGERDISLQVVAHDNDEIYAFATEFIGKLPGVRKTTTSIVPLTLKDVYQWRVPRALARGKSKSAKE